MSDISGPRRERQKEDLAHMRRLEWITLAYTLSCIALVAIVMGGSLALMTELVEDGLSLVAPVMVLVGDRISARPPTEEYPYGFDRAVTAAYLGAALALLAVGLILLGDASRTLVMHEHPSIGGISLAGHVYWIGWLAMPVLLWCAVPAFFMGRKKIGLAHKVCDKVLLADAQLKTANWQSAGAAMLGLFGVSFGLWWADAAAAFFISLEIVRSGCSEVSSAMADLMDRRPRTFGTHKPDPLPGRVAAFLESQAWIRQARVRIREKGRHFIAEATIVPVAAQISVDQIDRAAQDARELHPRLRHLAIVPTAAIGSDLFKDE